MSLNSYCIMVSTFSSKKNYFHCLQIVIAKRIYGYISFSVIAERIYGHVGLYLFL